MTRAKDELDLIVPQRFFTHNQAKFGDRHVYASVSRFIPKSVHNCFDCRTCSDRQDGHTKLAKRLAAPINIAAELEKMWQ